MLCDWTLSADRQEGHLKTHQGWWHNAVLSPAQDASSAIVMAACNRSGGQSRDYWLREAEARMRGGPVLQRNVRVRRRLLMRSETGCLKRSTMRRK